MMNPNPFINNIVNNKLQVYSQTIEDGVLKFVFDNIGTTNKYFIEFGAWDGLHLSNTANLRINHQWNGLLLEANSSKCNDLIKHEFINPENINQIFEKYNVPAIFDLLSIDVDGKDYWIWKALDDNKFSPRVVIIEFNSNLDPIKPLVSINSPNLSCYGASIAALYQLGKFKGYDLVFRICNQNLLFIKSNLLHPDDRNISLEQFINQNNELKYESPENQPHWNNLASTKLTKWLSNIDTNGWTEV